MDPQMNGKVNSFTFPFIWDKDFLEWFIGFVPNERESKAVYFPVHLGDGSFFT
jgi:hypothetical protein